MDKIKYKKLRNTLSFAPSNFLGAMVVLFNVFLFFFSVWLFSLHMIWSYYLSQIFFALHFNHCYLIMHETIHFSLFSNRKVNLFVGHLASVFALLPFNSRQQEHVAHHLWTGTFKEPSTDRAIKTFCHLNSKSTVMRILNISWRWWVPIFTINEHVNLWKLSFKDERKDKTLRARAKNYFSSLFLLAIYSLAMLQPGSIIILLKMLPGLYVYFILLEYMNLPHHLDSGIFAQEVPLPIWQHEVCTKSFKPLPYGLGALLMLNFNFHIGHHFFPNLPWHELKNLQKNLEEVDAQHISLQDEFHWHITLRKLPVQTVFKNYFNYSKKNVENSA